MFVDDEGQAWVLTPKGYLAAIILEMVPGLAVEDATALVEQFIEDAVDKASLPL